MPAQPALEGEKAMRDMVHGTALCLMNKQGTSRGMSGNGVKNYSKRARWSRNR